MCLGETGAYARGLGILAPHFARRGGGSELGEEVLRIFSFILSFHLLGESAKPAFYLLRCQNFLNRRKRPNVTERIANPAITITPKHIGRWQSRDRPMVNGLLECRVHIRDTDLENTSGARQCLGGRQQSSFRFFSALPRF